MRHVKENTVYVIDHVDVRVRPGTLAYAEKNRMDIAQNWRRECDAKPTLFDGEIYLAPEAQLESGVFHAEFQRTSFATLMYWRRDAERERPWHIFGVGVVVSAEGHLLAARMGDHSAVGGRVYFPAGSIDDNDIFGDRVDYRANMQREVCEETGLDLGEAQAENSINLVTANRSVALFRRYRFDLSTAELLSRIHAHVAAQELPELAEIIPFTHAQDLSDAMPSYVRAFTEWHFS
ncbi:NUDIX hydrolase [Falsochrobactrum shanghaiense]|uniref:NUDIX hydrolase n=1 Tax=Falsochrobactrum shanghaiense TaxID=2201899 RepID=A0A316J7F5_9HYPH|nr:NUDIX hydrolase [Falsochrobactrum shanghaiense]PWL17261.1 NUDIX hydrolase [Falsochrobactrum shanghaiense]